MTEKEFKNTFEEYRMRIFFFVKKISNDAFAAEEVTSRVFIKLWKNQPVFLTKENKKAWMFISAKHAMLDYLKSKDARISEPLPEEDEAVGYDVAEADRAEIHALVIKQIINLIEKEATVREKVLFRLHFLEGIPIPKVAAMLGIKQQTISNHLLKMRNKIKSNIKKPNLYQIL